MPTTTPKSREKVIDRVEIRPPTGEDLPAMADIDLKCFPWAWNPQQWQTITAQCPATVAVLDGRVIGCAVIQEREPDLWVIGKLAIKRAYRNLGIGTLMLSKCFEFLRAKHVFRVMVIVPESLCYEGPSNIAPWLTLQGFKATNVAANHYQIYGEQEDGITWQYIL